MCRFFYKRKKTSPDSATPTPALRRSQSNVRLLRTVDRLAPATTAPIRAAPTDAPRARSAGRVLLHVESERLHPLLVFDNVDVREVLHEVLEGDEEGPVVGVDVANLFLRAGVFLPHLVGVGPRPGPLTAPPRIAHTQQAHAFAPEEAELDVLGIQDAVRMVPHKTARLVLHRRDHQRAVLNVRQEHKEHLFICHCAGVVDVLAVPRPAVLAFPVQLEVDATRKGHERVAHAHHMLTAIRRGVGALQGVVLPLASVLGVGLLQQTHPHFLVIRMREAWLRPVDGAGHPVVDGDNNPLLQLNVVETDLVFAASGLLFCDE
eukprot:PhM_4_TR5496/c0_g1_i1/m.5761